MSYPFWDEWSIHEEILGRGTDFGNLLFYQHNEHKIGVGLILMKLLASCTGWSQRAEIFVTGVMLVISCLLLLDIRCRACRRKVGATDLIIPLLLFSTMQWENLVAGFQLTFILPVFFLVLSLWTLVVFKESISRNLSLILFAFLATYSSLHGIFVVFCCILMLVFELIARRRELQRKRVLLNVIAILVLGVMVMTSFIGYKNNAQAERTMPWTLAFAKYFSVAIETGFLHQVDVYRVNVWLLSFIAIVLLGGIGWVFYQFKKSNEVERLYQYIAGSILIAYVLFFVSSIAIGRASFGIWQATSSRYISITALLPIGVAIILTSRRWQWINILLLGALIYNTFAFNAHSLQSLNVEITARNNAWNCYLATPPELYDNCYAIMPLFPDKEHLNQVVPELIRARSAVNSNGQ